MRWRLHGWRRLCVDRSHAFYRIVRTLGAVVGLASLCACQFDTYTLSYATSKPDHKEVVGHWVATDATLRDLAQSPYQKARPVIEAEIAS